MLVDVGFGIAVALACCLFVIPWTWIVVTLWKLGIDPRRRGSRLGR